jgi:hypothetical protein
MEQLWFRLTSLITPRTWCKIQNNRPTKIWTEQHLYLRGKAAWTGSNLGYAPFGIKRTLASHFHNVKCPRMAKRGETQTRRWVPFGLGPIHPSMTAMRYHHV